MDEIVFLGTGGARVVVFKQIRASGGIWLSLEGTNLLVDPGPGCLVRCLSKREKLNPESLSGIIVSHRHLDHSADVNVMIEAMTGGGFKKKGVVFAPGDALAEDPVILQYVRDYVNDVRVLEEGGEYGIDGIKFRTPVKHIHGNVEAYGLNFSTPRYTVSYIVDTRFFPELVNHYRGEVMILNVVRLKPSDLDHLSLDDAKEMIVQVRPKLAILTHFGMTMIRAKPWEVAARVEQETGVRTMAARDGMRLKPDEYL